MMMWSDPFRELDRLSEAMTGRARPAVPMDAYRDADRFHLHFDLPGLDLDSLDLTVDHGVLTVEAERRWQPGDGVQVLVNERPQGRFRRQVVLGDNLDADAAEASYDDGVLTIVVPVAEKAKPRKVAISRSGSRAAIDVGGAEPGDGGKEADAA